MNNLMAAFDLPSHIVFPGPVVEINQRFDEMVLLVRWRREDGEIVESEVTRAQLLEAPTTNSPLDPYWSCPPMTREEKFKALQGRIEDVLAECNPDPDFPTYRPR